MDIVSPFLKEKIGFNFQSGGGANPLGLPDAGNIFTFTASSESTRLSTFLTIEKTGDTFTTEMYGYKANGERVGLTRGTDLPFDEKTIGDVARAFAANTLKFVKSEQDKTETPENVDNGKSSSEEDRLAEALGLTPNTLAARRAVADLTKNNPRRLELKDGTRVVVNNSKERVEKAIEDGNTDLQVRYKVRKSENNIIGKEKFYWDYVSEKEYNQAKEKGLKVAMEYFLQGEDKLGFDLSKYEYDYAKFLLSQQNKATEEPIEVTGKEFGEFDTSTKEGKKALREEAFNYLVGLAESGDTVFCPAVNAYVGFTKSAAKKYKSLGGNPIKLKLAAMIKEIIKKATLVRKNIESYDVEEQKSGITYDVVRTKANIDGKEYGVRTVLRHLSDGRYQYDLQVKDSFDAILDSIEGSPARLTKSDVASLNNNSISAVDDDNRSNNEEMQAILDGTQENNANGDGESKYVLNLFVEYRDENGNWVELKDEEDEPKTETSQTQERLVNEYQHDLLLAFEWAKERFHIDKEELLKLATFLTSDKSASDYQEELPFFHPASAKADFENVLGMGVDSNMNINALLDLIKQRFKHTEDKEVNGQQGIGDLLVNSFNQLSGSLEQLLNLPSDSVMTSKDENNLKASLSYVGKSGEMLNITLLNQKEELLTKTSIFTKEVGKKEAQYKFSPESTVEQVVDTIVQALQPLKSKQAEQEDKTVNSANQQEQQDRAFLEKTIAGDFDALSEEFEQQITEIAERYDGQENEMEALVMQAVDVFVAKLDELSA